MKPTGPEKCGTINTRNWDRNTLTFWTEISLFKMLRNVKSTCCSLVTSPRFRLEVTAPGPAPRDGALPVTENEDDDDDGDDNDNGDDDDDDDRDDDEDNDEYN